MEGTIKDKQKGDKKNTFDIPLDVALVGALNNQTEAVPEVTSKGSI